MSAEGLEVAAAVGEEPAAKMSVANNYLRGKRKLMVDWPGNVNLNGHRGYFNGGRLIKFEDGFAPSGLLAEDQADLANQLGVQADRGMPGHVAWPTVPDQINTYFDHRGNLSIVDFRVGNRGEMYLLITRTLEGQDLIDFQEAGHEFEALMREKKQKRAEVEAKAAEGEVKKVEEERALVELGRKCREHNLLQKLRDLSDENEKLLKRLQKAEK